jgi:hypothetical protein
MKIENTLLLTVASSLSRAVARELFVRSSPDDGAASRSEGPQSGILTNPCHTSFASI